MRIYTSREINHAGISDSPIPPGVFRILEREVMREYGEFERFRLLNLIELARTRRSLQAHANELRERNSRGDRAEASRLAKEADKVARLAEEYAWRSSVAKNQRVA